MKNKKKVLIAGAGPAGLTAAYELLKQSNDFEVEAVEMSPNIGGISQTYNYQGNRMDLGGHRFFSKSDVVMNWWQKIEPEMMIRQRISRMYYLKKFFDYPVRLNWATIKNLGIINTILVGFSFLKIKIIKVEEKRLNGFIINRFGRRLYEMFFKDYTQKLWGVPCSELDASWGAQRIRGLSITKIIRHAFSKLIPRSQDLAQKNVETSLIEKFLYPKHGPGQLWERVADLIRKKGGRVNLEQEVVEIKSKNSKVQSVVIYNHHNKQKKEVKVDYFISSMPIKDLVARFDKVPPKVSDLAEKLLYRDFITVGVLLNKKNKLPDNWIYIQDRDLKMGRLQIFNNWSPHLVKSKNTTWLGTEYFCTEGDNFWQMSNRELARLATRELAKMNLIAEKDVRDTCVLRVKKAYPCYFGQGYEQFSTIQNFLDGIQNMFCIGRNGLHRYNNQDHSMLTAMMTVEKILTGDKDKKDIWLINSEQEYHEEKSVLYQNRLVFKQMFRYFGASVIAAIVDLTTVYLTLKYTNLYYLMPVVFGFLTGALANFLISNYFVFQRKGHPVFVLAKQYCAGLGGLAINLGVVYVLVEYFSWYPFPAKVIALAFGFFFNFIATKFFAFEDCRRA